VVPRLRRADLAALSARRGLHGARVSRGSPSPFGHRQPPAVWALPAYLYLAAISIALALIDLDNPPVAESDRSAVARRRRRPAGPRELASGDWFALLRAVIGSAGCSLLYFIIAFISPRGLGMGDVKLAAVLGLYLGWLGWGPLAVGAFAAFLLGGVFAIILLLARRARRGTGIPFGPWMIAGAWLGIGVGAAVWNSYLNTFGPDHLRSATRGGTENGGTGS
jgi:leader peptidase (prepilin peptidase)/N-methyltransferase